MNTLYFSIASLHRYIIAVFFLISLLVSILNFDSKKKNNGDYNLLE